MTDHDEPAPGRSAAERRIAGYLLESEIGRGGMAVVYRARDPRLDRSVALKVMSPALAHDETFRKRFIRESRAAAALDHPNVIPVYEAGEADGLLFLAMRYVDGEDLGALLRRSGPLPVSRTDHILTQVASALDAAHVRGLVHRDVKPGNILLVPETLRQADHAYLADFGLAKRSPSASGHAAESTELTASGQVFGTADYIAPEQIAGRAVDGRADQYALACVAFRMLSGVPPFTRDEDRALLWAHLYEAPPSLASLRPGLPAAVDQVLARALAKSPEERYPSCRDFADALRDAAAAEPEIVGRGGPGRTAPLAPEAPPAAATRAAGTMHAGPSSTPPPNERVSHTQPSHTRSGTQPAYVSLPQPKPELQPRLERSGVARRRGRPLAAVVGLGLGAVLIGALLFRPRPDAELLTHIPETIRTGCSAYQETDSARTPGLQASVRCGPGADPRLVDLVYLQYRDQASMSAAFTRVVGDQLPWGDCTSNPGQGPSRRSPDGPVTGVLACSAPGPGDAPPLGPVKTRFWWTDNALNVLAYAAGDHGSTISGMHAWWMNAGPVP